jgi:hypothetical protein
MKKSVISAVGSKEMSGASRWLAALDARGARPTARMLTATSKEMVIARIEGLLDIVVSPETDKQN